MSHGYIEDFVCYISQQGGYLGSGDQPPLAGGGIAVNSCGAVAGCAQSLHLPDDVKAGLHGAHPIRVRAGLLVVIVLLFADSEGHESNPVIGCSGSIVDAAPMAEENLKSSDMIGNAMGQLPQLGLSIVEKESWWLLHHSVLWKLV